LATCDGDLDDISDGTYGKVLSTDIQSGHIKLTECVGTLDSIVNGATYGRVAVTDISAGHILLATCDGDLDDVDDGTSYGKVLVTSLSAGKILLTEAEGDLDDIANGTYGKVLTTDISAGHILLASVVEDATYKKYTSTEKTKLSGVETGADLTSAHPQAVSWLTDAGVLATQDNLDGVPDGATYKRILATDIQAGHIRLSECIGTLDDIGEGTTYGRVAVTDISAGHILLATCDGDLDDIDDGTYGKVLATSLSAGKILLTEAEGDLDDIAEGTSYGKVAITDISAGHILLATCDGDLDDIDDGSSYGKVALTSITAGKIIVAGLDSGVTDRIFADLATKDNVEAWRHASDVTMIDGGKIYAKSITADEIEAGTITADEIYAETITAGNLAPEVIPRVSCRVYRIGAKTIVHNTWTKVLFEGLSHDTHEGFDIETGIYTVQVAGVYFIQTNIRYADPVANKRLSARVEVNSTVKAYSDAHTSNTSKCSVQVSHVQALNVNDEIHIETYHDCGVNKILDPGIYDTYMMIHKLHD